MEKYLHAELFHRALGDLHQLHPGLELLLMLGHVRVGLGLVRGGPIHDTAAVAVGLGLDLAGGLEEVGTLELLPRHVVDDGVQRGDQEVPVRLGPALTPVLIVPKNEKIKETKRRENEERVNEERKNERRDKNENETRQDETRRETRNIKDRQRTRWSG